jgi:phosphopantothenoylcysteine decarboxylase/phosphopantothenate--cysteine ligase
MGTIILGVCGSIACYKAAALTRLLTAQGDEVQVIMTPAATRFVGTASFRALSGRAVATDEWNAPLSADGMDHIHLSRSATALLIAPASADFLAKAAAGIADNSLLSTFLAADIPRLVAPAMNQQMWRAAATQRNIQQLLADGVTVIGPNSGVQACGENGEGRMSEPENIIQQLKNRLTRPLNGLRFVISAGATVEYLDDMRIISNMSSGRMGFCIAEAAHQAGAEVVILAGQTTAPPPPLPLRRALSGKEMLAAAIEECRRADVFISVAAVADFRPSTPKRGKIAHKEGVLILQLNPTTDILSAITEQYPRLFAVGFAAQSGNATTRATAARKKRQQKKLSVIAANALSDAGKNDSELLISSAGEISLPRQPKPQAAQALIAHIAEQLVSHETSQEKIIP